MNLLHHKINAQPVCFRRTHLTESFDIKLTFRKRCWFTWGDLKERKLIVKCNKVRINASAPLIVPLGRAFFFCGVKKLQNILKLFTHLHPSLSFATQFSLHTHFYTKKISQNAPQLQRKVINLQTPLTLTHFHVMFCIYCFRP